MRSSRHKIMIVLLTVMMVLGTGLGGLTGSGKAYAAGAGDFTGDGSLGNPYLVGTAAQLNKIRGSYLGPGLYFRLTGDIDLSGYPNWTPIGDDNTPFQGHMDGNSHTITGLTINRANDDYSGLFGYIDTDSTVSGMKLEQVSVKGWQFAGGLVGYNNGGSISSSYASGNVSGMYNIGGLLGYNAGGQIDGSHALGTVTGADNSVQLGGLVGNSTGSGWEISNSYASVVVKGGRNSTEVGGLAGGVSDGKISNSYALGDVTGGRRSKNVGGLVGVNDSTKIISSYASGHVSGTTRVGGLIGNESTGEEITDSYATGNVSGEEHVGGLIGRNLRGTISGGRASGEVKGSNSSNLVGGLVGENLFGKISGSQASGAVLSGQGSNYVGGLTGRNESAEISSSSATGEVSGFMYVGGLVGHDQEAEISYSYASGHVNGEDGGQYIGGLVGYHQNALISHSYALGNVSGGGDSFSVGGLVGDNHGEIQTSYASGKVSGVHFVGGLVGYTNDQPISTSFASGDVSGIEGVGGLVGYHMFNAVSNSYASGNVSGGDGSTQVGGLIGLTAYGNISNSYVSGKVSGSSSVGGFIGEDIYALTVNSFYDTVTTGQPGTGSGIGKVTSEMQDQSTYEADSAHRWDFSNTWAIDARHNGGYPYLRAIQAYLDYDGNGHTGGTAPANHSYMPGTKAGVYSGVLNISKTGYVFDGWNTQADGSGSSYRPGDFYTITLDTTLYAKWKPVSAIATLTSTIGTVSTGGTATESITGIPYGTTLASLKAAITPAADATFEIYEADGTTVATVLTSGHKIIVTAQDGMTQVTYTVTVAASSAKEIASFSFAEQTGAAVIDTTAHTVAVEVSYGTSLNGLVSTFSLSAGASAKVGAVDQVSGVTANDFTVPVVYVVKAADGSTQSWTVTVSVAASSAKEITTFSFAEQTGAAVIDATAHTVAIEVAHGTSLNGLVAAFGVSAGASAKVGGMDQVSGATANSFTAPVVYVVKAADGSTQSWTVTVTVAASSAKELTSFSFAEQTGAAVIEEVAHTVAIEVAHGTSLNGLVATFGVSVGASAKVGGVDQVSAVTANDFTAPVVYVVRAGDGSTQNWTVTVSVAASSGKELTAFSFAEQTGAAVIDASAHTVAIEVVHGTSLNSLVSTFSLSAGASAKAGGVDQVSGTTANDFTAPVVYVVKAADGSTQSWTVTVSVAASSAKEITAFSLTEQTGVAVIDASAHTVAIEVVHGTSLNSLVSTFSVSAGASAKAGGVDQVSGTTANDFTAPVVYVVKAADGSTQNWTVTVSVVASSAKEVTAFSFAEQTGAAVIDASAHTIAIEVAHGTSLNGLVSTFSVSAGASAKVSGVDQVSGTTVNDFTAPVVYVVKAADGSTQSWTVTVTVAASSAKELTSFSFAEQTGAAVIEEVAHTVAIEVAHGTSLNGLVATFGVSVGASAKVGGVDQVSAVTANDFTAPVVYVVKAEDGSTQSWTITVSVAASSAKEITAFSFAEQTGAAVIDAGAHTVAIEVSHGTSLNGLVATFSLSSGASAKVGGVDQVSGVTANDFTTQVIYVVKAADGSTQSWTVTVSVAASNAKEITAFSLTEQTGVAVIDASAHTVAIEVVHGTSLNSLVSTFSLSAGASAKAGGVDQVSGTTANDFTAPVVYVVKAADGSTQSWTITVSVAASSAKEITVFSLTEQTGAAVIDASAHTVAIEVAHGTSLNGLVSTFSVSAGASAKVGGVDQVSGTTANDFTAPVVYVVKAADGSAQNWTVTVTVAASSAKEITAFGLAEQTGAAVIDASAHTVAIEVAHGTSLNGLVATFGLSAGASAKVGGVDQVSGTTANDFSAPVVYVVKAADGSTQNWTVTVSVAASSAKELTSFSFAEQTGAAVINAMAHIVAIEVSHGTSLNGLVSTFSVSAGASAKVGGVDQVSSTTANDFTAPVLYVVKAADGSTQNWTVTVSVAASSAKELTVFSFAEQTGTAVIDTVAHTVAIEVSHGTSLNGLVAAFSVSAGASAKVDGVDQVNGTTANDFTAPVVYVVKAADGSTQNWTVTVSVAASSAKELTSFSLAEQTGAAVIDAAAHTVAIEVAHGTSLNALVSTFNLSAGASAKVGGVDQVSGTTGNDFTAPVVYVVKAADGSTQNWTVTVTVAASSAKEITVFSFAEQTGAAVINATAHTVAIEVVHGTSLNGLVSTFSVSAGASAKVGGVDQVSGATANDFTTPAIYVVKAADGSTQSWTVTVSVAASSAKKLTAFSLAEQTGAAVIDAVTHTVAIEVAYGTSLNGLVSTFGLSAGASVKVGGVDQVSGTTANDFTVPVVYVVKAADGSTQSWTVMVSVAASSAKEITVFSFAEQTGTAVLDTVAHTVAIEVSHGTSLNGLVAAFSVSAGASAKVDGVDQVSGTTANDFTAPVVYVVKAADGSTQNWTVTVSIAASSTKELTAFSFAEQTGAALIDASAHTVAIEVAYGTSLNGLVSTFGLSAGASAKVGNADQASGTTANDFTTPVVYVVKAADGSTQNWTVTVNVAASSAKKLTAFSFPEQTGAAVIDAVTHTVAIEVAHGTSLNSLVAAFGVSAGASAKVGTVNQVSGATANDFTTPVVYVVKAADGSTQNWTVTVSVAASNAKEITSFSFSEQTGAAVIDAVAHTVVIEVAHGTSLDGLVAAFVVSAGASAKVGSVDQVSGSTANDFTAPVVYVVKAADGSTQNWTVTVSVAASSAKEITAFSVAGQTGVAVINATAHTVAIEVAHGTNINGLVATFSISAGASAKVSGVDQVSGTTANDFTAPVVYVVKAADGSTQSWTVTVTVAANSAKDLTAFSFQGLTPPVVGAISGTQVALTVPHGTAVTSLVATFTSSAGSTVTVGSIPQVSGTTSNDFTSPLTYTVTAQDGTTKRYTVTLTVAANSAKDLTAFSFQGLTPPVVGAISGTQIALTVPNGTAVTSLVATFTNSAGSTVTVGSIPQVSGTTANDFTSPVTYTVTAQDGTSVFYTVVVTQSGVVGGSLSLSSLMLTGGGVPLVADSVTGTTYQYKVSYAISSISVTASAYDSHTRIVGSLYNSDHVLVAGPFQITSGVGTDPIPLTVGVNRLELVLTAADGSSQTYLVFVNRTSAAYSNAHLQSLQVGDADLKFNRDILDYTLSVGNRVEALTVKALTQETQASVTIDAEPATSKEIQLSVGSTIIPIEVTAQDGITKRVYRVTVKRAIAITAVTDTSIPVTSDPVSITVPQGVKNAKIALAPVVAGSNKEATLPLIEVHAETAQGQITVVIPEGTKVTAPEGWDGMILLPEVQSNDSLSVSGSRVSGVIEIGSPDVTLTFDTAIRLLFPKQGGKLAGYVRNGGIIPITASITSDTQATADREIAPGGEAKLTLGEDMVVWTKHFTKYVFYLPVTPTNTGSSGGGGGGPSNTGIIYAPRGGTLTLNGVHIEVPEGAIDRNIQVTVDKLTDASSMPIGFVLSLVSDIFDIKKDMAGEFQKSVVLTLPYDKSKVDFTKSTVGLYGWDEKKRTWLPLDDQQVDQTTGKVSGTVRQFTKFAVLASDKKEITNPPTEVVDLGDIQGHWAETSIRELVKLGVIHGYSDRTFKPNNSITRAEFVTIIVKALQLQAQTGRTFADTEAHWARSAIEVAASLGVVTGYGGNTFGPDDLITREQMAAVIVRAAHIDATENKGSFADNADISDWARTALATATAQALMNGYEDGTVKPQANSTRAEAATVILRALQLKKSW